MTSYYEEDGTIYSEEVEEQSDLEQEEDNDEADQYEIEEEEDDNQHSSYHHASAQASQYHQYEYDDDGEEEEDGAEEDEDATEDDDDDDDDDDGEEATGAVAVAKQNEQPTGGSAVKQKRQTEQPAKAIEQVATATTAATTANNETGPSEEEKEEFFQKLATAILDDEQGDDDGSRGGRKSAFPYHGGGGANTSAKQVQEMIDERLLDAKQRRQETLDLIDELTFELQEAQMKLEKWDQEIFRIKNDFLIEELTRKCQWNTMFKKLVQFRKDNGHCHVPYNTNSDDPELRALGRFVGNQRSFYKYYLRGDTKHLKAYRIDALNRIGFVWNPNEIAWQEKIKALERYKAKHGHIDVPLRTPGNEEETALGRWVNKCRNNYLQYVRADHSTLNPERVQQLTDMGFVFIRSGPQSIIGLKRKYGKSFKEAGAQQGTRGMTPEQAWHQRYKQLKVFYDKHGHIELNKREIIAQEKKEMAEILKQQELQKGTKLDKHTTKGRTLKHSSYHQTNGEVVGRYSLTAWLGAQRKQYQYFQQGQPSILNHTKIAMLEEMGIQWNPLRSNQRAKRNKQGSPLWGRDSQQHQATEGEGSSIAGDTTNIKFEHEENEQEQTFQVEMQQQKQHMDHHLSFV